MHNSPLRRNEQGKPGKWTIRFTFPAGSYSSAKQVINVIIQLISIVKAPNVRQAEFSFSYAVVTRRPTINSIMLSEYDLSYIHPCS